jgi:hypothetical protein
MAVIRQPKPMMTTGVRHVAGFAASAAALARGDWMVMAAPATGIRNTAHHTASVSTAQTKLRQRGTARIAAPRERRAITAAR